MSWQAHVDAVLAPLQSGHHIHAAAICGLDGGIWAQGGAFPPLTVQQVATVGQGFDGAGLAFIQSNGLILGENKFNVVQCDPGSEPGAIIRAKFQQQSFCAVRCHNGMVIAFSKDPTNNAEPGEIAFGDACTIVIKIAGGLSELGY